MQIDNNLILQNYELRSLAREQLKGKWGTCLLLCLIYSIILGILGCIPFIGSVIILVVGGPLALGLISCFIGLVRNQPIRFENLFDGFKSFKSAFILNILISIFTFLWALLLIIPGIVAYFRYAMSFYILSDNPQLSAQEALNESKRMMNGYKGKLFCLQLSFIGWFILSILTFGVGFLWLIPYMQASAANFYQNLKNASSPNSDIPEVIKAPV